MTDISLIPLDALIEEIEARCKTLVLAYETVDFDKTETMMIRKGTGTWGDSIKLSAILHNECLNSWEDELETLKRINDEGIL